MSTSIYDGPDWILIDIGYEETVEEIIEMIRQMDFPLARCQTIVATHADADHVQGLAKAKQILKTTVTAHPLARSTAGNGRPAEDLCRDRSAGDPPGNAAGESRPLDRRGDDQLRVGDETLEVWHTPGHTDSQLAFRMGSLLFSGDNIFRDGCVGAIDAHHGSDIPAFLRSLRRIQQSDVEWLLPSHGPLFRKDRYTCWRPRLRDWKATCTWRILAPARSTGR